jgi:hypothetical protein
MATMAPDRWTARCKGEDQPNVHHDALELPDGQIVKVTKLRAGQHATVLQMPVSPREITPSYRTWSLSNSDHRVQA